jgi:threonine/homoserine/homoserine lactone efflux protein
MRHVFEFLLIAVLVTLTPGPGTATVIRVAARDGQRAAQAAILGHSAGVFVWAALSALGISALIVASRIAYDALHIAGALVLVILGFRSIIHARRGDNADEPAANSRRPAGWRSGLLTGLSNPKVAVFFIALFPQFIGPDTAVLPWAMVMAALVVMVDIVWYSTLAWAVDRAGTILRPRVRRTLERVTGAVMVTLGLRLALETP